MKKGLTFEKEIEMRKHVLILIVSLLVGAGNVLGQACTVTGPSASTSVCIGGNVTLSVTAGGTNTYQWQYSSNGSTGWANVVDATPTGITYSGGTTSSLTITGSGSESVGNMYFQCIVTGTSPVCGPTTSTSGTVTIVSDPTLSAPTALTTICKGGNTTISTTASGGTGSFNYQWEYSADGSTGWANVVNTTPSGITYSGGTSNSLTVTGDGTEAVASKYYRCVVTSTTASVGCNIVSATAQIATVADPTLSDPATLTTLCKGGNTTISTTASGGTGSFNYQWEYSSDGSTGWANVANATPAGVTYSGGTTNSLTVTGDGSEATASKYYRCVVTSSTASVGCNQISATAQIATVADPTLSAPVALTTLCQGSNTTISTTASGGTGSFNYQWEYSSDGSTGWSNVVDATPAGITYSGGTTNSLTVTGDGLEAAASKYYRCVVTSTTASVGCNQITSTAQINTVTTLPLTAPTALTTLCIGGNSNISTSVIGGTSSYTYQWEYSADGSTGWANVIDATPTGFTYSGATSNSLTITGSGSEASGDSYYRCVVNSTGCSSTNSSTAKVTTVSDPTLSAPTALTTICKGGNTTISTTASGGTGSFNYQWEYSADGSTLWANVVNATPAGITYSGGTSNSLTVTGDGSETTASKYYRCVVTSTTASVGCNNISATAQIATVADPTLSAPAALTTLCKGGNTTISTTASGGTGSFNYQWEYSSDGSTGWSNVLNATPAGITYSGGTTNSLTVTGDGLEAVAIKYYRCVVTSTTASVGCNNISATAQIATVTDPTLSALVALTRVCIGGSTNISTTASGGTGSYSYQWQYSSNGSSGWANVVNATPAGITYTGSTSNNLTVAGSGSEATISKYYRCILTDAGTGCDPATSTTAEVVTQPNNASSVTFSGSFTEGGKLTVNYVFSSLSCFPNDRSLTRYSWNKDGNSNHSSYTANIAQIIGDSTYVLPSGISGNYIMVKVEIWNGSSYQTAVESSWSSGTVGANSKPVADNINITGGLNVGQTLSGTYTYTDAENDPQATADYQWLRSSSSTGTSPSNIGTNSPTYILTSGDAGNYIGLQVTPKATTGTLTGDPVIKSAPWHGQIVSNAPVASNVQVIGDPKSGTIVYGYYLYSDVENDPESGSTYAWYYADDAGGTVNKNTVAGATSVTYKIADTYIGKYIGFSVIPRASSGVTPGSIATSPTFIGPVTNAVPVASNVTITGPGTFNVNDVLTGNYDYYDAEGDIEGISIYEWWRSSDNILTGADEKITSATSISYQITLSDAGKYLFFQVSPKAQTGDLNTGTKVASSATTSRVNSAPYAVIQPITYPTTVTVGQVLTGHYQYFDNDGNTEGASLYRWLRDGNPIPGATAITYTIDLDDEGSSISFEVTPVASTGYPNIGSAVTSASVGPVPASGTVPVASEVCIQGKRKAGELLTGKYRYTYSKAEGTSTYRWLRGNDSTTVIVLATTLNYTLGSADISSGENIYFEVTPKSVSPVKTGTAVKSTRIARITIPQDHYSNLVDTVKLTVIPAGGSFSGPGVTNGIFSPKAVGDSTVPYQVRYVYNIVNTVTTCAQEDIKDIWVDESATRFDVVKNPICHDDGPITIEIKTIPVGAIPYYGYGFFFNWQPYFYRYPDNSYYWYFTPGQTDPRIISQNLGNGAPYVDDITTPWNVTIDPTKLSVGNGVDIIYLYYRYNGYYYLLEQPLNVEEVATITEISNLNTEYCIEDPIKNITVYGIYPSGGTATWTGDILTDKDQLTAKLNPALGISGQTYPISYQYTSVNGCKSNILNSSVLINPMPDASFNLEPSYNVEGSPYTLVSSIPYGGVFLGDGISGNKLFPDIAGTGPKNIVYKITDINGCIDEVNKSTVIRKAKGTINGLASVECYSNTTKNITVTGLPNDPLDVVNILSFTNKKNSIVWTAGSTTAQYNIEAARAGYDTLTFSYTWDGVPYSIKHGVYIDSIGKIEITGLKAAYCDYETNTTLNALVENSTGNGSFAFSGPAAGFTNFNLYAIFRPSLTPSSATPYTVSYTHTSNVNSSGCTKTATLPVTVNKSPDVSIFNSRITVNIKETPLILSGSPVEGAFSGKGVYKVANDYVFDPEVAGLGNIEFALTYTDSKNCTTVKKDTLIVSAASGTIQGINANNQYCYDGLKDTLTYTSSKPWFNGSFSGAGITNIASAKAVFDPAAAGKGDHDLVFTYYDQYDTEFEISATVNVDSLGVVEIKPIAAGDEYCNNDTPFELITTPRGGVFTGPVTTGYLNPAKALGDTAVTYTYLNVKTGCSITGRVPFTIHPAPLVSFTTTDICIENETDSIRFINNTTSADAISTWLWSFSDIGGTDLSSKQTPAYIFKSGGQHLVTLTATTINNCIVKKDVTIDLGIKPRADFYWTNECYVPGDSIMLFDTTFSTSSIASRSWNFFDGKPLLTGTKLKYPKNAVGIIPVQYIVNTTYANCSDTVTKNVYIRPNIVLSADGYFENFESGNGGWSKGDESINSWSFGTPDRTVIKSAASGAKAWFTRFDSTRIESSSVISPCFDFTNIERPMVSLNIRRNFNEDRDGAALQYRIGDAGTWKYVGALKDGINWYSSVLIAGKPGGNQVGWTSKVADPEWTEARHTLDELKGKKDVKLRIAYGSDGTARTSEGMAFDDIFIGERKRNVLLEHFANTSSLKSSEATAMINAIDLLKDKDIVNIQYHTNFPGVDSFYVNNPADASARILYYGLTKAPYSFVDGGTKKENSVIFDYSSTEFDNSLTPIDVNEIIRRSLISPVFDIRLDSLNVSGGVLTISGNIVALDDTTLSNLTLYLAVIEKSNSKYTGAAGETIFRNVFRKFVPDAAGITLGKTWTKGVAVPIQDQSWIISKTLNSSDIEVVAFIQNSVTKEVYQAASMLKPKITVGIEKTGIMDNIDYMLYPNPAKHQLTIRFGEVLEDDTDIFIYDFGGTIVRTYKTGSGETEFVIDDLGLKDGIYLIRVSSGGINYGFRKLIISGS